MCSIPTHCRCEYPGIPAFCLLGQWLAAARCIPGVNMCGMCEGRTLHLGMSPPLNQGTLGLSILS